MHSTFTLRGSWGSRGAGTPPLLSMWNWQQLEAGRARARAVLEISCSLPPFFPPLYFSLNSWVKNNCDFCGPGTQKGECTVNTAGRAYDIVLLRDHLAINYLVRCLKQNNHDTKCTTIHWAVMYSSIDFMIDCFLYIWRLAPGYNGWNLLIIKAYTKYICDSLICKMFYNVKVLYIQSLFFILNYYADKTFKNWGSCSCDLNACNWY